MSKKNWHEKLGKSISADEWYRNYSTDIPRCKVCNNILSFIAVANNNRTTHFRHPENSGCPTIGYNHSHFANLLRTEQDETNALYLKKWVLENGYLLYKQMCEILGASIKYPEFTEILIAGNHRKCWYYFDLTVSILPYTLLVNYGVFQKEKGRKGREQRVFLAFDSTITTYEQLWNNPSAAAEYVFRIYPDSQEYEVIPIGDIRNIVNTEPPEYFQRYLVKSNLK
ncbi:hypothetical protein [Cytobacillus firmus]|uniref:hypothetical protein n=1 Tax=Cytobacillus firmus TaxID=1399 RepID=UPI0030039A2D